MKKIPVILFLLAAAPGVLHAQQDSSTAKDPAALVAAGTYVFEARTALPMRGSARPLSSGYTLLVTRDTLQAYLPYFGRAYSAPVDPTQGGIKFTSTHFDQSVKEGKKGGWTMLFKPQDVSSVRQLQLTVTRDGYASLQVISNQRQPISFQGIIEDR